MWNRIGNMNSGATHQSPLASRVPMVQVEGPPPEVVTLGRTNNFDAATYSGTGDWLPTPDSAFGASITKNVKMRYSSTFGGGSFEFTSPDFNTTYNDLGFGMTYGGETSPFDISVEVWHFRIPSTTTTGIYIRSQDTSQSFIPRWELSDSCEVNNEGDPQEGTGSLGIYQYLVPGAWNQIVMTFGGGSYVKAYVNGALVATSAYVSPVNFDQCTGPTTISAGEGSIAIIRAYDRIITDAEVLQNYNAVKSRFTYTLPATVATTGLINYFDAASSGVSPTKYSGVGHDGSGVWRDQVGTADMTLVGSPAYDSSTSGGQLTFVAASAQYGFSPSSLVNTDNMTVEIWYKPTTTAAITVPIISSYVDTSNTPWMLRNVSGGTAQYNRLAISYKTYTSGTVNITGTNNPNLTAGTWYQIIFRKINGTGGYAVKSIRSTIIGSGYLQSSTVVYNYPASTATTDLFLMTDSSVNKRNGTIGLVRIYNTALTNAEILQNYNATKARFGLA